MCPDQYKYINQIKQEGLFSEKFTYFLTKTKAENRSYGVFRDSLLTWPWHVTDFRVSRGHKTLWWLEIVTKRIQNRSQRFRMHFNSAFSPWRNYFKIVVTEFRQAMTASVRSCDLNDFAGSKVAKQTFFSRHIKSYLRLLPTRLKARNNIFTVKTYYKQQ